MLAQTVPVTDTPGWGLAEWATVIILALAVLSGIVGAIVQLASIRKTTKKITDDQKSLREENTTQHAEGRALVTDVRDRLLDLHGAVDKVDTKVGRLGDRLEKHLEWHQDQTPASDLYRTEL